MALNIESPVGAVDPLLAEYLSRSLNAASAQEVREIASLNVILGDDDLLRSLNRDYAGLDEATDVLAFDLGESSAGEVEGDIYISLQRAAIQAGERGESPSKEIVRLAVHGFLHLCGVDHDDDNSLQMMVERGERYIVDLQEGR